MDNDPIPSGDETTTGTMPVYDPYAPIRSLYQQITGGAYTPSQQELQQWGSNVDANYLRKIQGAIGNWWQQYQAAQPAPPPTTVIPPASITPGGNGGGGQTPPDIYNAPLTKPFDQKFAPPPMLQQGGPQGLTYLPPSIGTALAPQFQAPRAGAPPVFGMPNTPQVQSGNPADYQKAFQQFLASQQYGRQ